MTDKEDIGRTFIGGVTVADIEAERNYQSILDTIEKLPDILEEYETLKTENEEMKKQRNRFKKQYRKNRLDRKRFKAAYEELKTHCASIDDTNKILYQEKCELIKQTDRYKQALEKIREIACQINITIAGGIESPSGEWRLLYNKTMSEILNIINEVKDD